LLLLVSGRAHILRPCEELMTRSPVNVQHGGISEWKFFNPVLICALKVELEPAGIGRYRPEGEGSYFRRAVGMGESQDIRGKYQRGSSSVDCDGSYRGIGTVNNYERFSYCNGSSTTGINLDRIPGKTVGIGDQVIVIIGRNRSGGRRGNGCDNRSGRKPYGYTGNSNKQKAASEKPKKDIQKVVEGTVTQKKPAFGKRIAESFTGDDSRSVGDYIVFDVIIPAAKSLILDVIIQGSQRAMYGESAARPGGPRKGYTPYGQMSKPTTVGSTPSVRTMSNKDRMTHNFDEITFPSRADAEVVIDNLKNLIEAYDSVSVSDLYELVGITGSHVDEKWGWFDVSNASVNVVRGGGYSLNLPRTETID